MPSSTQANRERIETGPHSNMNIPRRNRTPWRVYVGSAWRFGLLLATVLLAGCAQVPNQWVEDGPATTMAWDSPTARDVCAKYAPSQARRRSWEMDGVSVAPDPGVTTHWPLYFEDPFVDKGHGRQGLDKYHIGWEDYVALPYGYARFTLNWLMFPVSAVVTPPWTLMESDGRVSRQLLGYDHDATPARKPQARPPDRCKKPTE